MTDLKAYYVTMIRGKRTAFLLGPFAIHADALALVETACNEAYRIDPWSWFDLFGTSSILWTSNLPRGKLNYLLTVRL